MTEPALIRFASRLRERWQAERVLLFGSRALGTAKPDSDYDFIIVSRRFIGLSRRERPAGIHRLFYESGAYAPMDVICMTPEEFDRARQRISLVAAVLPDAIDLLATHPGAV